MRASWIAVAAAAGLVAGTAVAGWWLTGRGVNLHLGTTWPVAGHYQLHLTLWLIGPLLLAAAIWHWGPRLADRLPWPALLAAGYLTAAGWAVALARVGGPSIGAPLTTRWEYLAEVDRIDAMGIGTYLGTFTDFIIQGDAGPGWANHVAGHPPLITLLFVLLARAGLGGPGWAAALCIGVGAAAVPAVLSTVRLVAGAASARAAAPYLAAAPVALWVATSADAIIAGTAAVAIALLAHAAARTGVRAWVLAAGGGLLLGGTVMLSYGMVLLAPIVLAVVVALAGWRRSVGLLAVAAAGALAVLVGFALAGFWWLDGLDLTAQRVRLGRGWSERPLAYFLFASPAALAVAVGPAVVAALPRLRALLPTWRPTGWQVALPAAAALVAMALAMASTLSKGEVERIWLPFAVWLLPLAALLPRPRLWLALHLGWPIVVAATTTLSW